MKKGGSKMKKAIAVFFGVGAIVIYGLAILGFLVGDESARLFLMLGLLGGACAVLYLVFEEYI